MSGGSAFQSLTVLGKKDILLFSVPQVIVWKAREWLCLVGLFCGVNLESLLMAGAGVVTGQCNKYQELSCQRRL